MSSPMYVESIYIPFVLNNVPLHVVQQTLEHDMQMGKVGLIESIPQIQEKTGIVYYKCYVYFLYLTRDHPVWKQLFDTNTYKMQCPCNKTKFWNLHMNTSDLRFSAHIRPVHMDLVVHVPIDMKLETIENIINGLDLGCVHSLEEIKSASVNHELAYPYTINRNVWEFAHPHIWRANVKNTYKVVLIRFHYWYRTRPAMAFQKEMSDFNEVRIPFFDGNMYLIFYPGYFITPSLTNGFNPYVWECVV